ncbi:MAG: hypothetical protein V3V73_00170 [Gammaproteobacteria bacterium]
MKSLRVYCVWNHDCHVYHVYYGAAKLGDNVNYGVCSCVSPDNKADHNFCNVIYIDSHSTVDSGGLDSDGYCMRDENHIRNRLY